MLTFRFRDGLLCTGGPKSIGAFPRGDLQADILLFGRPEEVPRGLRISWPGEYDIAGIAIRGIGQSEGQQVSYTVRCDGVRCTFLSSPLQEWTEAEIGQLGDIDLLVLPAENPKVVQKLCEEIDPRLILFIPGEKGKVDQEALRVCGAAGKDPVPEYKLKGQLPAEGREVVVLGA